MNSKAGKPTIGQEAAALTQRSAMNGYDNSQLARRIRRARLARGWSLRELGRRAGLRDTTILRIERGETGNPSSFAINALSAALEIQLAGV